MLGLRPLSWFPELRDSVLDFRAATTVLRATSIIILTGTIGTRTCTIIRTPEIHIHIIPRRPDPCGTAGIEPTIIATTITTASNQARSRPGTAILLHTTSTEKSLQDGRAFILQEAGRDIAAVIEPWHLQKIHNAPRSAGHGICATENDAPNSRMHQRPRAHRAWLLRDIQIAIRHTPIANS